MKIDGKEDVAVPSADTKTADYAPPSATLDLSNEERETWLKTGDLPERLAVEIIEDDGSKAKPKEAAEKTELSADAADKAAVKTAPVSEPGIKTSVEDSNRPKRGAEQRSRQLDAQIAERLRARREAQAETDAAVAKRDALLRETAELEAKLAAKKTSPASPDTQSVTIQKSADGRPVRPRDKDFRDMASWDEAMEQYQVAFETYLETKTESKLEAKLAAARQAEIDRQAAESAKTEHERISEAWNSQVQEALGRHEDYADIVSGVFPELKKAPHIDAFLLESRVGSELLYRLAKDYEEGGSLLTDAAKLSPTRAAIAMGKIEDEIESTLKPQQKQVKIPRATKPTADVSGRSAAPLDDIEAALESGNFSEYLRLANQKELADRKQQQL